jgi:hypothetical protein
MNIESKAEAGRFHGLAKYWAVLVVLIVMFPSFYWIVNDHHAWLWDQSWYGEVSVDLWFKLSHHLSQWFPAMATAFGSKSPGIAWLGQLFVPIGRVIGSVDLGLLLSVVATQIGSIVLFYKAVKELAPGRPLVAAAGILLFACAPLFLAMSHQYVAEALQLFGVTYFYFLAATGHGMRRMTLLGNLLLATAIALLAKVTSPIYCLLPGLIVTYTFFQKPDAKEKVYPKDARWGWLWLVAGVILCVGCATWYLKNLPAMRQTLKLQTSLEFTLDYGRAGTFFEKLNYWLHAMLSSFQFPWVIVGQLLLVGVGVALPRIVGGNGTKPRESGQWRFDLLAICSVIHVAAVVCLCSTNYNEETRYLLPLLPAIATINIWLISKIRQPWLLSAVIVLLSAQWICVCSQALGLAHFDHKICSYWVIPMDRDRKQAREVVRIVQHTAPADGISRYNIVGIELPWLNANTLSFFAAKEELKTGSRNYYTGLGYGAKELDPAWKRMSDLKIEHFISLEEAEQPANPNFLNLISIPALRRIRDDPEFVSEPFKSTMGVVLFGRKPAGTPTTSAAPAQ